MNRRVHWIAVLVFGCVSVKAQYPSNVVADSLIDQHLQIIDSITHRYLYNPERFIVGKIYYPRGTRDNHPFFLDNYWKSGSVEYEGEKYSISMMKYDVQNDGVVMLKMTENLGYPIQLDKKAIPVFLIEGHRFVYMGNFKNPGYYEELCTSRTKVWAKWTVWEKIDANSNLKIPLFVSELLFIIIKNNNYYEVKSLNELYKVFSDRKRDLKKFTKENKLSFRNDKPGTIKILTEEYDNLNN